MKNNFDLPLLREERKYWHSVELSCLDDKNRTLYLNRKKALDMYIDGHSTKEILYETGLRNHGEARRLLKKCLEPDNYGNYHGYSALIPFKRVTEYKRSKEEELFGAKTGKAGLFNNLLNNYPELKSYIDDLYFGRISSVLEKNITPEIIHRKFLDKCKALGIKEHEYPYTVKSRGKRSLYTYLKQLGIENPMEDSNRLSDNAYKKLESTGIGQRNSIPEIRPFSVVQIDGHEIDCRVTIEIPLANGDIDIKPIKRFWLLTLIDVATRTILGYSITIESAYDRFDVLKCIKNAIVPKKLLSFEIKGMEYPENTGYHSLAIPETEWAVFDEIMLDNAKAHLAKDVISQITEYLKATVNFGSIACPESRGIIERFFRTFEGMGIHRLPSTTGSCATDTRNRNAEKDAIKYRISFNEIVELTEIVIAQYNNLPHNANNGFAPIEVMKQRMEKGLLPNYLEMEKRKNFMLNYFTTTRTINGKLGSGTRPFIHFEGADYRSDVLSKSFGLVGYKLKLQFNPDDIRTCKAYFEDGSEFCDLCVVGKWRNFAHSLDQRKAANALLNERKLKGNVSIDPIVLLEQHLIEKSKKDKASRNKSAALQNTMKTSHPNNIKEKEINNQNNEKEINKGLYTIDELEKRFMKKSNQIKFKD